MRPALALLAMPALLAGCSESTGVQPEDLAGTWTATTFEFQSVATRALRVDVIDLGFSLTFVIESSGAVTTTITGPGTNDTDTGTLTVTGSNFTLTSSGDTSTGTISRDGDTLTLNVQTGAEFDFDDDGSEEPATITVILQKD